MQEKLKVEQARTEDLVPYVNNAKIHTAEQVDQIAASIEQFGFNDPIAVWTNPEGELEIVEGHGRVMAASKMGIETLPIIKLDHLSDEARRAYTHVHNKLTMNTGFDWATIDDELANLNYDFTEFGFDAYDVAEAASSQDDFERFSDEIKAYGEHGEEGLKSYNVVICCLSDDEMEWLRGLLGEDGRLKRLYMASELMEAAVA